MIHFLAVAAILFAQTTPSDDAQVRQTVDAYLHGLKFNDVASLRKAFLPDAKLYFVKRDGTLGALTQEDWYKGFAASAGKEEEGTLTIEALDITGNAASVKVKEVYPTSTYTDYVSLLKIAGEWKIVNKIFVAQKNVAAFSPPIPTPPDGEPQSCIKPQHAFEGIAQQLARAVASLARGVVPRH